MRKFRSRLQSLHRLREQQEQLARGRVADCQRRQAGAEQRMSEIRTRLNRTSEEMNSLLRHVTGAETMNGLRALYGSQQEQLQAAQQERLAAAADMERALLEWHAARADLKAIANRLDRQRADHRRHTFLQEEHRQQETAAQALFQRTAETSGVSKS